MTDETKTALLSKLRAPVADERVNDDTLWSWAEQIMGGKEAHHVGRDRVLRFARAALASAPVAGEASADDANNEAFGDFADQFLTDGNGYAPVSTFKACSEAFNKAWPNREAAFAAAKAEYDRLHKAAPAAPQASEAVRDAAFSAGVKAAADLVKKMVDDYDADLGNTDPETGTREYPGEGATWVCEMQELEESIRALSAQPGAQRTGGSE